MRYLFISFLVFTVSIVAQAQDVVLHEQKTFPNQVPASGYSGITWLGGDEYAVVADNTSKDGFFRFRISLKENGDIANIQRLQFFGNNRKGRDSEGVAFFPADSTLFVSGENDNEVMELSMNGTPTGRNLPVPRIYAKAANNYGLEALTYNAVTHRFWTTSESTLTPDGPQASPRNRKHNLLRLQSFDDQLKALDQYLYKMDMPSTLRHPDKYVFGVSALAALDDGRILVLEREAFIPDVKIGAFVRCVVYSVVPGEGTPIGKKKLQKSVALKKTKVAEWTTALGLLSCTFANYEGMCVGPRLQDGGQVIVLLSDSQNQYAGILQDWFRTMVIY